MDADKLFSLLQCVNTFTGGLMAGISLYINIIEHPARMAIGNPKYIHRQWMASFDRAGKFMPGFSLIPMVGAGVMYYLKPSKAVPWVIAAGITLSNLPYSLVVLVPNFINPIHDEDICSKKDPGWVIEKVENWTKFHGVRTILHFISFGLCVYTLAKN